jgi:predicted MPP superfamily phosphohydrolase
MKRRDFIIDAATLGASLMVPLGAVAETGMTHLKSEELSSRASIKDDFSSHFIAVGDWGRNGEYGQLDVAKQMGLWAASHPNDFIISTGDNLYPLGAVSELDPQWHYSFENVYTAHSLQCNWYAVLGNHDHGTDSAAQVRYSKVSRRWHMPAQYYTKQVDLGKNGSKEKALFIMIDSDPMLFPEKAQEVQKQMEWLKITLKKANADVRVKWKIIVGHHPYYTVGPRINDYDTLTMRKALAKIFEDYKVDVYLSGHDHSLQHLKPAGFTHQFISGAGSELTPVSSGIPYSRFQASENGFLYFSMDAKRLNVKAINVQGTVLYETELAK